MIYEFCALVENNIVISVIAANSTDWCVNHYGGKWLPVYADNYCGIGWTWDGEKFVPPVTETIDGDENENQ